MRKYKIKEGNLKAEPGKAERRIYKEVKPYTEDINTGEILNPTPTPKVYITDDYQNLQDTINSYKDNADIVKLLEKINTTGNKELLNHNKGEFMDIENLPDNYHDLVKLQTTINEKLKHTEEKQKESPENGNNGEPNTDTTSDD